MLAQSTTRAAAEFSEQSSFARVFSSPYVFLALVMVILTAIVLAFIWWFIARPMRRP